MIFLLPQWCFVLPPYGRAMGHREMWIQLKCFLVSDYENLQEKIFLRTQSLAKSSNLVPFPQNDPTTHKRLFPILILKCLREYSRATHALAPFSPTPMSFDTTLVLTALHPESNGYFPLFLKNYELDQNLELFSNSFKPSFQHMPHMSTNGPSMMVFEHL